MTELKAPRRTQEERRTATRNRILDAAVESLLERGYAATTVGEVQDRAGVARGTLLHHFPTRVDIMVAAIKHISDRRVEQFERELKLIPSDTGRLAALVDLAWRDLNSPMFFAALELWVAARSEPELRDALIPVERELFSRIHESMLSVVGAEAVDPRLPTLVQFTLDLLTGLSMSTILTSNLGSREVLLRRWKTALSVLMGELDATQLVARSRRS
ncbi:TetR/AcrR family transcriptional regulator [Amycolatopsis rhizosphaerae]|uniref:TetR/AcrR family transcriptional regulator n=1 Tax=Amycolatopsis rhizosphaerae TaxID=2053003 RepID=UPI001FE33331|nr:TetR/AcrR family transcriptional regulator [Amycolatopsis rhizosphaerae]